MRCRRPSPAFASPRSSGQRGFTLIELMVAMVVSAIVVLGVFAFSSIQASTTNIHDRNVRVQRALEGAMWSVGQDMNLAGLGWARFCTELRVYDGTSNQMINPGATIPPSTVFTDAVTGEPYWVLRDGVQAFWNSTGATSLQGSSGTSADPASSADAFDVIVAEANYVEATGVFHINSSSGVDTAAGTLSVTTSANVLAANVAEVQQMFPPGSFLLLVRPTDGTLSVHPTRQAQCVLLQVTNDVSAVTDGEWLIPVEDTSGFNENLAGLLADDGDVGENSGQCEVDGGTGGGTGGTGGGGSLEPLDCDDWTGDFEWVVPLGRLRWSRYEIDYAIPQIPYLVRYDIIGWQTGDLTGLGGVDYPDCAAGSCDAPQLHLPGSSSPPAAVAIGPMIEDMQVAIGCDGYTPGSASAALFPIPPPDTNYSELDQYSEADGVVDEQPDGTRDQDEWLGNAANEQWAPDCVYWGTAENRKTAWAGVDSSNIAAFRMSPQAIRITLTASSEFDEEAGGLATPTLLPVEDRPAATSPVGARQRFHLTERFTPPNLRWRDPSVE